MALPPGVSAKTVTIGIASFADGSLASGRVTISLNVNVLHIPSNRPVFSSDMTKPFVDGMASFDLMPTDAPGLNRVDFSYHMKVEIQGANKQPDPIDFLLPAAGPDTVDLDGLVTVPSSAGIPISVDVLTAGNLDPLTAGFVADTDSQTAVALRAALVPVTEVSFDAAAASDGAVTVFDTGQAVIETHSSAAGSTLAVASGVLTNTSTVAGAAAGYYEALLSGNVGRIGSEFVFAPGGSTDGGRMTLACFKPSIKSTYPTIPPAAAHFLIGRTTWSFGVWDDGAGSATVLASGTFATPLAADGVTRYQTEVSFGSGRAVIYLPDGTRAVVTDSRIDSLMGSYACWEVYLTAAATDYRPGFTAVWADPTGVPRRRARTQHLRDVQAVAKEIARQKVIANSAKSISYGPTSPGVTTAVPTSSTAIDSTNLNMASVVVPDTGYVLVEQEGSLTMSAAASVFWSVTVGGTGGSGSSAVAVVDNGTFTGRARAMHRMGPFTPGSTISVLWKHQSTVAAAANFFVRGDNGHGAIMKVSATS